jgi:hypothetical protein
VSLADRGVDAGSGGAAAALAADNGQPQPAMPADQSPTAPGEDQTWAGSHQRVTFYCDKRLLALVNQEVATSRAQGEPVSKSQIIVEGLTRRYQAPS